MVGRGMASKRPREPGRKGPPATKPQPGSLPTKDQILEYVQAAQGKVGNREIARAFHLKGGDRIAMKRLLREIALERAAAQGVTVRIPPLSLCTDNGAMIAALASELVMSGRPPSTLDFGADSTLPVTQIQVAEATP